MYDCSRSESSIQHATSVAERATVLHHNRVWWAESSVASHIKSAAPHFDSVIEL